MITTIISGTIGSLITGVLALIGVIYASKKQHSVTLEQIKHEMNTTKMSVGSDVKSLQKDIENLSTRVDKHNQLIDRMFIVEKNVELLDEKLKNVNHRIDDLEDEK